MRYEVKNGIEKDDYNNLRLKRTGFKFPHYSEKTSCQTKYHPRTFVNVLRVRSGNGGTQIGRILKSCLYNMPERE